jgi:hypothetical protein
VTCVLKIGRYQEVAARTPLPAGRRVIAVLNLVDHVFSASAVDQVLDPVVCRNSVDVTGIHTGWSRTDERLQDKLMHKSRGLLAVYMEIYT